MILLRASQALGPLGPLQLSQQHAPSVCVASVGGVARVLRGDFSLTPVGTLTREITPQGVGVSTGGGSNYLQAPSLSPLITSSVNQFSVLLTLRLNATGQTNKYAIFQPITSAGLQVAVIYGYAANQFEVYSDGFSGSDPRTGSGITVNDTLPHTIMYTYDGATWSGYLDGAQIFSVSRTFLFNSFQPGAPVGSLLSATSNNYLNATLLVHAQWARGLPPVTARALTGNSRQLFAPQTRRIWVPGAVGGNSTGVFGGSWTVRNAASGALSAAWTVRNATSGASAGAWSVRGASQAAASGAWSVRNASQASSPGAWSVRGSSIDAYAAAWSVRGSSIGARSGAWTVRNASTGESFGAWSIGGVGSSYGSFAGAWSVRNSRTATVAASWSVRGGAAGSVAGGWSIKNATTGAYAGSWTVRNASTGQSLGAWSVRAASAAQRTGAWSVRNAAAGFYSGSWSIGGDVGLVIAAPPPVKFVSSIRLASLSGGRPPNLSGGRR